MINFETMRFHLIQFFDESQVEDILQHMTIGPLEKDAIGQFMLRYFEAHEDYLLEYLSSLTDKK